MKKSIKVLLLVLILFLLSLIVPNKKLYGYYVGQQMYINYNMLTQAGSGPFTCTQPGQAYQCATGAHLYQCYKKELISQTKSGESASVTISGRSVEWTEHNRREDKVGPYKIKYKGDLYSIRINTNKGPYVKDLETGTDITPLDGIRVGRITNDGEFYIYVSKDSGIKRIRSGKVVVKSIITTTTRYKYWWSCIAASGYHSWPRCGNPATIQILTSKDDETDNATTKDSDKLPGSEDEPDTTEIVVQKKDYYGEENDFTGTKFALYDSNNNLVAEKEVNSKGKAFFKEIPLEKKYILKETGVANVAYSEGEAIFNGKTYPLDNIEIDLSNPANYSETVHVEVKNKTYFKFAGRVFLDKKSGKLSENGYLDSGDTLMSGIKVIIFNSTKALYYTTTDANGYFEFGYECKLPKDDTYYFCFEYDGLKYEPTSYYISGVDSKLVSKATEGISNDMNQGAKYNSRVVFNKIRETISGAEDFLSNNSIYAYTGNNGIYGLTKYGLNNSKVERENINLGLIERPTFDLSASKDSVEFRLTVNDVSTVYPFDTVEKNRNKAKEALNIELKGADLDPYIKHIRKSDLQDKDERGRNTLNMEIVYRIKLSNLSNGFVTGKINKLRDWYDKDLILISIKVDNEIIGKYSTGTSGDYNYIDINEPISLRSGQHIFVEIKFKLDTEKVISKLIDSNGNPKNEANGIVKNNFTEIMSYSTYYQTDVTEIMSYSTLGGTATSTRIRHKAGDVMGLIDVDSTPANFNPNNQTVVDFIKECDYPEDPNNPKYPAYEEDGKKGQERHKKSLELFEDDADRSPGLILKVAPNERKIEGMVFLDGADTTKLKNKERIGDGEYNEFEVEGFEKDFAVEGVKVTLWEDKGENGIDSQDISIKSVRSDNKGKYKIEGFAPGKYYLTYEYGTVEGTLSNETNTRYNGQDYKSTLYFDENYQETTQEGEDSRHSWWYIGKNSKTSDARDNWDRRNEINEKCKKIKNYQAEKLNVESLNIGELRESQIAKIEEFTKMTANTNRIDIEIDCPIQKESGNKKILQIDDTQNTTDYNINNINFGIIERPRNEIILEQKVTRVVIVAKSRSADVNNILIDAKESKPGVAWNKSVYDQKTRIRTIGNISITLDDSLRQGSTMYVYYELTAKNNGEVNYINVYNNEAKEYYYKGIHSSGLKIAKTNTGEIINYPSNDLNFIEENNKDSNGKTLWRKISEEEINNQYFNTGTDENILENNYINNEIKSIKQFNTILTATEHNRLANRNLNPGESVTEQLVLQQTLSSEGNEGPFKSSTEVIMQKSDVGRRNYSVLEDGKRKEESGIRVSIPGNLDPVLAYGSAESNIQGSEEEKEAYIAKFGTINESDSTVGEPVDVIPPFGKGQDYTRIVLIGIAVIVILGVGIYAIKKKVL